MSFILSVYSVNAFKEYLLPAIDNSNFSLVINKELFGLSKDIELPMEILDGNWKFNFNSENDLWHSRTQVKYNGELLKNGHILSLVPQNGDKISIIVNQLEHVFSVFKKYDFVGNNELTIGNDINNMINHDNMGLVSRFHAKVRKIGNSCVVEDSSTNGCFVNGRRISNSCNLVYGDCLDIFGLKIIYLDSFIAVNATTGSLKLKENSLHKYNSVISDDKIENEANTKSEKQLFHRSPRNILKIDRERVEIEAPPTPKENANPPTFMAIGPSLTMALPMLAGSLLAIYGMRSNGMGSSAFMYTGLITALGSALIGTTWAIINVRYAKKKNRESEIGRFDAYSKYLIERANDIKLKYENNTNALITMYPEAQYCSGYDRGSMELWNRNSRHKDFLAERLGIGQVDFPVEIDIPKERFTMINDSLAEKPKLIKESYKYLKDVPICVDLFERKLIGVIGGIAKKGCFEVMYNLVAQIAANNCYTDIKMIFIYDENRGLGSQLWGFSKWLPHVWAEDKKTRFVSGNKTESSEIFYELTKTLRIRSEEKISSANNIVIYKPYYILFLEAPELVEGELISKYIYNSTENYGISTIILAEAYYELPNACEYIIENTSNYSGMYDVADGFDDRKKIDFDKIGRKELEKFARRLSSIEVKEEETGGELPNDLTFFDMYHVTRPEELGVLERWKKNRTSDSMKALIGQKAGGVECYLDVHEKYHGPHGLVAGTTGSGKSETLQTYMLSLSINYSPDDIGFFIIDYKGGGMANLFEGLPHMLGQISNLSGNQIRRAMVSIKSENMRRQRIFNEYGVNNINLYMKLYKNNEAKIPIPHMFIIIDEFAELKREEPDFMRELISVAQVGRSLGVHLILATQKPSGTVDDNIWSNSKFRLCLRVQDKQDSADMLHKPDAAYITQAGRGYLQVGNDELYEMFQSGYSGAVYDETQGTTQTNIARMLTLNGKAAIVGSHAKIKQKNQAKTFFIAQLLTMIDKVIVENSLNIRACQEDSALSFKIAGKVFEMIKKMGLDYPQSDYNLHRISDLIVTYASIFVDEKVSNIADKKCLTEVVIRSSFQNGKKLPELKEKTQLDAVISHLANIAQKNGYVNNLQLWLPVLPTELYLSDLNGYDTNSFDGKTWNGNMKGIYSLDTIVGLYDDPKNQAQQPFSIDLAVQGNHAIVGTVVSGKSTFVMTYLYSLINRYTPEAVNIYILDYSSKMLGALEHAPQVGGIMFEEDEEKVSKFFVMLIKILEERKKRFKGGSYSQYIQANGLVEPSVILVIDNMASFREKTSEQYDDLLMTILKEGINYGIYVVVTAAGFGMSDIPNRMGDNFRSVICLEMNETFAYSDALRILHIDILPEENVKGRGITKIGDAILEFQTALALKASDDYKRGEAIKERCKVLNEAWDKKVAKRIPEIPEKPIISEFLELEEVKEMAESGDYLPIGYDRQDASIYGINLSNIYCYVLSGKERTGKTNMMLMAIQSAYLLHSDIAVIDFDGKFEQITNKVGGRYIASVEEMYKYFSGIIPEFKERNKKKKSYDGLALSYEEVYKKMQEFKKIFIFIWDLPEFILKAENPGGEIGNMSPFLCNILDKGYLHNVFWFAIYNQEDKSKILGNEINRLFVRDGVGIHFGGKVEEQQLFNFDYLNYADRMKALKPGIGMLPEHDDNTSQVVVPLHRVEVQ